MSCPNLATKSDISALEGRILEALSGLATKGDISDLESKIDSFRSTIEDRLSSLNSRISGLDSKLDDALAALGRIEDLLEGTNGRISSIWDAISNIVESLVSLIRDPIVAAINAQRALVEGLFDSLQEFIRGYFDGIQAFIDGAFASQKAFIDGFFGSIQTLIQEYFGLVRDLVRRTNEEIGEVLALVRGLGDDVASLRSLAAEIRQAVSENGSTLRVISSTQLPQLVSLCRDIGEGVAALRGVATEIRQAVSENGSTLRVISSTQLPQLVSLCRDIGEGVAALRGVATEIRQSVAENGSTLRVISSTQLPQLVSLCRDIGEGVEALPGDVWGYGLSCGPAGSAVCRSLSAAEDPEKNFSDDDRQKLDDIKDDLDNLGNDLEAIAKVTGVPDFPGKLPKSLLGDDNLKGETEVESIPQFILWLTKQLDALVGEFPVSIEVTDNDLTQSGNQKQTIQLRNIAEAFAELYGQGVLTTTHQSVQTNGLVRVGTELTSLKVMVAVAQDLIMATTEFLGFKTKQKRRDIDTSFTLKKSGDNNYTLANFLDSDKISYKGYEFDDDDILIEYLPQLMYGVSLIKAATLRGEDDVNEIEDRVKEVLEDGASAWDKFQEIVNNPDSEYNIDQDVKFKITDRDVEIDE
ncbi:hypothetical protein SAMN06272755_2925 [Picosynechococcus sp. OG1]|uniref:hypothetical protein n=1 Tax=Cyanophyceae TaxID=3028117 RepID=UPI00016DC977|nr:conserved hypothetical protein [Picosynechococcus sp. PCC 7002]SMH55193.1 hypothetical protein SAMN06272755_2925 [Picosynechococcus sp. OG1]SMQ83182.1 hypothetical protein SAMN06272774_2201 [Synechococcus sp. 7002]